MIIVLLRQTRRGEGNAGATRIAAALGVPTLATGDVLRAAVRDGTPTGLEARRTWIAATSCPTPSSSAS